MDIAMWARDVLLAPRDALGHDVEALVTAGRIEEARHGDGQAVTVRGRRAGSAQRARGRAGAPSRRT